LVSHVERIAVGGERLSLQETVYVGGVEGKRLLCANPCMRHALHKLAADHPGLRRDDRRKAVA
jgi:hypothetical protein